MTWMYNGNEFKQEDVAPEHKGFVYEIVNNNTSQKYLGKKLFWSTRMLPPLAGKKRRRKKVTPSNWMDYYSSSKYLQADVKKIGKHNFTREILHICTSKTEMNYIELLYHIVMDVLNVVDTEGKRVYYNENVERVFYHSEKFSPARTAILNKLIQEVK